jgi:hypothetical protein
MHGSCHCGKIQFEVTGQPFWVGSCYCRDCQKITGTASMTFAGYKKEQTSFQGEPKEYNSSEKVKRYFCEHCSSPVLYVSTDRPENVLLSLGLFDNQDGFKVQRHIWTSQKPAWVYICDEAPQS